MEDEAQRVAHEQQVAEVVPAPVARVAPTPGFKPFAMIPQSIDELIRMAEMMANSAVVPKSYQGKPADVFVAVQMGLELGLAPMQSVRFVSVINGFPAVWGDGMRALILRHPDCEWIEETWDEETWTATCRIKRRGYPVHEHSFGWVDAERAGLPLQNEVVYQRYPRRQLQHRAFSWPARDRFADALVGLQMAEEVMDIEEVRAPAEAPRNASRGMAGLGEKVEAATPSAPAASDRDDPSSDEQVVAEFVARIESCDTFEGLEAVGVQVAAMPGRPAVGAAVRPHYITAMRRIVGPKTPQPEPTAQAETEQPEVRGEDAAPADREAEVSDDEQ